MTKLDPAPGNDAFFAELDAPGFVTVLFAADLATGVVETAGLALAPAAFAPDGFGPGFLGISALTAAGLSLVLEPSLFTVPSGFEGVVIVSAFGFAAARGRGVFTTFGAFDSGLVSATEAESPPDLLTPFVEVATASAVPELPPRPRERRRR